MTAQLSPSGLCTHQQHVVSGKIEGDPRRSVIQDTRLRFPRKLFGAERKRKRNNAAEDRVLTICDRDRPRCATWQATACSLMVVEASCNDWSRYRSSAPSRAGRISVTTCGSLVPVVTALLLLPAASAEVSAGCCQNLSGYHSAYVSDLYGKYVPAAAAHFGSITHVVWT